MKRGGAVEGCPGLGRGARGGALYSRWGVWGACSPKCGLAVLGSGWLVGGTAMFWVCPGARVRLVGHLGRCRAVKWPDSRESGWLAGARPFSVWGWPQCTSGGAFGAALYTRWGGLACGRGCREARCGPRGCVGAGATVLVRVCSELEPVRNRCPFISRSGTPRTRSCSGCGDGLRGIVGRCRASCLPSSRKRYGRRRR